MPAPPARSTSATTWSTAGARSPRYGSASAAGSRFLFHVLFRFFAQPGLEFGDVPLARAARRAHEVVAAGRGDRLAERRHQLLVAQRAAQERQAPQRDALSVDRGLHELVELAEKHRTRRLEVPQAVRVQPQ